MNNGTIHGLRQLRRDYPFETHLSEHLPARHMAREKSGKAGKMAHLKPPSKGGRS